MRERIGAWWIYPRLRPIRPRTSLCRTSSNCHGAHYRNDKDARKAEGDKARSEPNGPTGTQTRRPSICPWFTTLKVGFTIMTVSSRCCCA
jgi:hypothetical protein